MTKNEFLDQLRMSLAGKLEGNELQKQLDYYEQYISRGGDQGKTEEEILRELGDPRLIAKTIANTAAMSNPMHRYYQRENRTNVDYSNAETQENPRPFRWYHKLIILLPLILAVIIILSIVFSVVGIVIRYLLPVVILLLVGRFVIELLHR